VNAQSQDFYYYFGCIDRETKGEKLTHEQERYINEKCNAECS